MRIFFYLTLLLFIIESCNTNPHQVGIETFLAGKTVTIGSTAGWLKDDQSIISQPSNVITHHGYTYVFYVSEPSNSLLAGTGYTGKIHYAFSRDQGNTWSDQGLVLSNGLPGTSDAMGVCKPAVIKVTDDNFFYLYYVAVPEGYNPADGSSQSKTTFGLAKLIFNDDGIIRVAIKLNSGKPVLETSEANSGKFDAFHIDDPNPINMNGQIWLYYTGLDKQGGTPRIGLAVSADINANHIKQNNSRALLDGSPSLFQKQDIGVMAIFTDTQTAWYASDGLHFNKLKQKFPTSIKNGRGNGDTTSLIWGLSDRSADGIGFNKWKIN